MLRHPCALLGGLSPAAFMRQHWQRRPRLIRAALPASAWAGLDREALVAQAAREGVASRLVSTTSRRGAAGWTLRHGPFTRRQLPPRSRPGWTLLVQGLDRELDAARALLDRFDFLPAARLDDLMISWASEGGGVGPHVDSYDVFLLQLEGRRRWRVGPPADESLVPSLPLKILQHFEPEEDWLLEPGDMLYLPPGWGHEGTAEGGECLTASVGFRAPSPGEALEGVLGRWLDATLESLQEAPRYRDPGQPAVAEPARVPARLRDWVMQRLVQELEAPGALDIALGEWLSEPGATEFEPGPPEGLAACRQGLRLHRASRMHHDEGHVYLNGEAWRAAGRDAVLMQRLAHARRLDAGALRGASRAARGLLAQWLAQGWVQPG